MSAYLLLSVAACALAAALLLAVDANRLYGYTVAGPFAVQRDGVLTVGFAMGRSACLGVCFFGRTAVAAIAAFGLGITLAVGFPLEWPHLNAWMRRGGGWSCRLAGGPVAVAVHLKWS